MSLQNKGNWKYEYTDENGNRFYKLYNRQNKQLSVLNLRHYEDDGMDMNHVNWEMWNSPSGCEDEDHAETLLEYYDSGIFGSGFLSCLTDAVERPRTLTMPSHWEESPYKLSKDLAEFS
jgi:hypothetical protein